MSTFPPGLSSRPSSFKALTLRVSVARWWITDMQIRPSNVWLLNGIFVISHVAISFPLEFAISDRDELLSIPTIQLCVSCCRYFPSPQPVRKVRIILQAALASKIITISAVLRKQEEFYYLWILQLWNQLLTQADILCAGNISASMQKISSSNPVALFSNYKQVLL